MTDPGRANDDPEASGRLLFAAALLAGALFRLILLGNPDLFGSDEGPWAIGARNIVEGGFSQLLGLSRAPLGDPAGTPVLFPLLLSLMVRIFGAFEWAVRLPSVFAGLVSAFILERIVRRGYGQPAGHVAGAFAALFPPMVAASRAATVEPTLLALGLAGIIFGLRAFEEDEPFEAAVSGLFFGLGFLAKGYAVGLFLAPLLVALAFRPHLLGLGRTKRSLATFAVVFVLVSSSQLLSVAILAPETFSFHVGSAFGASAAAARVAVEPTAFGADLKTIVKSLFFFLPLVGVGMAYLFRDISDAEIASGATAGDRRLSHRALWGAYGIELLVVVAIAGRVRLSSIPVMPALAALAGFGGAALLSPLRSRARIEMRAAIASGIFVMLAAAFLMSRPDDPLFGGRASPVGAGAALATIGITAVLAAIFASGAAAQRLGGRAATLFLTGLLTLAGVEAARAIRYDLLTHQTGARELADQIAPAVASLTPRQTAFRCPEPEGMEFRLFRTGHSWNGVPTVEVLETEARLGQMKCWAYREASLPDSPSGPPAEIREWLRSNARDVTLEVDARAGRRTGLRVFVPKNQ